MTKIEQQLIKELKEEGLITEDQIAEAEKEQKRSKKSLGKILIESDFVEELEVASKLGKIQKVPFIILSHYEIDPQILQSIPEDIIHKYKIVPVDKTGNTLTVALSDPSDIFLMDELKLLTKCDIIPVISFESDIMDTIEKYFGSENAMNEMIKSIEEKELPPNTDFISEENDADQELDDINVEAAPVVKLVNLIIAEAIKNRASDIHFEPYENDFRVRHRIDGVLNEMPPPPKRMQNAILSRIKIISDLDIAEKRLPQDGRFTIKSGSHKVDVRVSTIPTVHGEKIVMRLLDKGNLMLDMTHLGFDDHILKIFERNIRKPYGMVLVTGPTGSGKSTTLYSALSTINDPAKNIMTVEDPVEYQLFGINQVQAKPDIGLSFAAGLRSFLRQDPDIIMVGEIRDLETAEIGVKAALTGHLVLSTLHTNDAPSTVTRMVNMGLEPFLITASLNLVVAQRLTRKICENCKKIIKPSEELLKSLNLNPADWGNTEIAKGEGCDKCTQTGYRGRLALYEVMEINENIRTATLKGASSTELKKIAVENNMTTLRQAGLAKVKQQLTTLEEVFAVTMGDE